MLSRLEVAVRDQVDDLLGDFFADGDLCHTSNLGFDRFCGRLTESFHLKSTCPFLQIRYLPVSFSEPPVMRDCRLLAGKPRLEPDSIRARQPPAKPTSNAKTIQVKDLKRQEQIPVTGGLQTKEND